MAYFWLGVSLFLATWWYPLTSQAACDGARALPNRVIALIDGREENAAQTSRIARNLAGPLAQKGLFPVYLDVAQPLPNTFETSDIAGVVSWFVSDVPDPWGVAEWLAERDRECGMALPRVAVGELGGAPLWHAFGVDRARAVVLHDGARDKIKAARDWMPSQRPVVVAAGLVVAPVVPEGGAPIVRFRAEDGLKRVLGFRRGRQTWISDRLMPDGVGRTTAALDFDLLFASYTPKGPYPVPDVAMFQGRRISLSVLLSEGWGLRASHSGAGSLGIPAYTLVQRVFGADGAPVTFGWTRLSTSQKSNEVEAAAAVKALIKASHVYSFPLKKSEEVWTLEAPQVLQFLPASTGGVNAYPLPSHSAVAPLIGPGGFGDPTGLHARAAAVARSAEPWPFAPDTMVVHAKDLLSEAGRVAVMQARALHASKERAAMHGGQYAELLKGAVSTQIEPLGSYVWRVSHRGELHSLRFDQGGSLTIDLTRSIGVLGTWTMGSALFVALDPAVETAFVALDPEPRTADARSQSIELVEAGPKLERLQREGCQTTVLTEGAGQITVRALHHPTVQLEGELLPVTSLGRNLWQLMVPDHHKASAEISFAVGCD